MERNIFVTDNVAVPPVRWRQAFPAAEICQQIPESVSNGTIVWLHNKTPEHLPGRSPLTGVYYVVLHDQPSDDAGLAALSQGASGYCNAHATPELLQTIASVIRNNGLWVGESLLTRLISGMNFRSKGQEAQQARLNLLSERERDVAQCVVAGDSNKEIARKLSLSERTIKAHLSHVFEKLSVRDRLQLALLLKGPL